MSLFNVSDMPGSVRTIAEFDALLDQIKIQNPVRYKTDTESGYFERFRKTLVDYVPPTADQPVPVEEPAKENSIENSVI